VQAQDLNDTMPIDTADPSDGPSALADALLGAFGAAQPIAPLTEHTRLDVAAAYRVAAALRRAREAGGARVVGRKIGFSNRTIWPIYGIDAPIWGDMFDDTVPDVAPGDEIALGKLMEPRIEPEIAFGLAAAPSPDMDDAALLGCCAWVAHGVELVQSPYPGWRFRTPDAIAAGGMHGMLLLGPRRTPDPGWLGPLGDFTCRLTRDGRLQAEGHSSVVLEGPLPALRHLASVLADDPESPGLRAGEIVTTGTLTDALPVAPGQRWTTELAGLDLPGLDVRF
jgi:2-oxo-3-hexenedioate decarboxylase